MDTPLVGTSSQNYRYFYVASAASIVSMVVLFVITGYTAHTATEIK
jgi:membrane protein DedA with SNARE-associated domain